MVLDFALNYLLPFCILIGVLVAVHEFGHFSAARALGIRVTDFAVGMGPELVGRNDRRGCRWSLRLLPIGGYVKFWGDENAASAGHDETIAVSATEEERREMFHLRGPRDRAIVLVAGPLANFVLGMVILTGLYAFVGHAYTPTVVSTIVAGDPADRAGMKVGDRIVAVDGEPVDRFQKLQSIISQKPDAPVVVTVERDGRPIELRMRTVSTMMHSPLGFDAKIGRIGIAASGTTFERLPPLAALTTGVADVWYYTKLTLDTAGQIVVGMRSAEELGGPIKIVQVSGAAFQVGFSQFVFMLALLSINLGVFNLFPIPVLDGGHLVICAIEGMLGRPANRRIVEYAYRGGALAIVTLLLFVSWNDVSSIVRQVRGTHEAPASNVAR